MRNDYESNYLAHHGILGQKWGKKNGPPYPLDAEDHSAAEKKAEKTSKLSQFKNRLHTKEYKQARSDYARLKYLNAEAKYQAANNKRNAEVAKEKPWMTKYDAKLYDTWHKNYEKAAAESEAEMKKILDKYGNIKINKYDTSKVTTNLTKHYEEELKKLKIQEAKPFDKDIQSNKKEIASNMAKEMTADIKRWAKENQSSMPKSFKGKSDEQIEKAIAKKLEKNIQNYNTDTVWQFSNNIVNFNIDGIKEYSDNQPLSVDYDIKAKKVKNFYYL